MASRNPPQGDRGQKKPGQERGTNLGKGLAGVTSQERRDLAGSGDDAPTKDQSQRPTSGELGAQSGRRDRSH